MAFAMAPSTPGARDMQRTPGLVNTPTATPTARSIATPSPGRWRHPKFDEISRRQASLTFTIYDWKRLMWNVGVLFSTWGMGKVTTSYENIYYSVIPSAADFYTAYFVLFFRVLLVYNIVVTLLPLIRKQDTFSDIPLTPSQRSLLGLNPNDTPPAPPGAKYITPPRYPRSSTPRSFGTPGSNRSDSKSTSGSPLSRNGSPSLGQQSRNLSGSPSASPLWQRVVGGGPRDSLRRNSYGSASPLGPGFVEPKGGSVFGAPATPSPTTRRDASVGLSSRWLYERGKASPGRNFL